MGISDTTESTVAGVFRRSFDALYQNIVIPEFQRPYCWNASDIRKLLNDIDALRFRNDLLGYYREDGEVDPYYFGTVCFRRRVDKDKDGENHYTLELLDGQQRLTSFLILTALLCKHANNHKDDEIRSFPSFVSRQIGDDWSDVLIVKQPQTIRHIREVYQEFDREYKILLNESLALTKDETCCDDLYTRTLRRDCRRMRYIFQHCVFAVTIVTSTLEAAQFFKSENYRGHSMSLLDILKAHHMRFASRSDQKRIQKLWAQLNVQEEENVEAASPTTLLNAAAAAHQRWLVEELVLPVVLMPYGINPLNANNTDNVGLLKGLLGTPRRDRLVDEKIALSIRSQGSEEPHVTDLLSPIRPGLPFFEMLDQYRRIADAVNELCCEFHSQFSNASKILQWGLICWADRFLPMKTVSMDSRKMAECLSQDLDFLAYQRALHRFLSLLSKRNYGNQKFGVYGQVRFNTVLYLMGCGSIADSLFLLPHRSISPAACLQEFNRRISPEVIGPKFWQMEKRKSYRNAYASIPYIVSYDQGES